MASAVVSLNKHIFAETLTLRALRISKEKCHEAMEMLSKKNMVLRLPKMKSVRSDSIDENYRLVLCAEGVKDDNICDDIKDYMQKSNASLVGYQIKLSYDDFSTEAVLKRLLPASLGDMPSSFETIGHIAHINLKNEFLPYKNVIGQVLLDKNRHLKTVVNKTDSISNEFRVFPMEVVAGTADTRVKLKESGCIFQFDFAQTYWNSRLNTEHSRIIAACHKGEVIVDLMCGVGPFAIPLAKKQCTVHANDLNPASYKYLVDNAKLNKVQSFLKASNLDARTCWQALLSPEIPIKHVIMNLPASAIDFLDIIPESDGILSEPFTVHCYTFAKNEDEVIPAASRVMQLDLQATADNVRVREVRNVAPNKTNFVLEFQWNPRRHSKRHKH